MEGLKCMQTSDSTKIAVLQNQMDNIKNTTDRIEKKLDDFLAQAPSMFAGKWVERALKTGIAAVLMAVLLALLALIGLHLNVQL